MKFNFSFKFYLFFILERREKVVELQNSREVKTETYAVNNQNAKL